MAEIQIDMLQSIDGIDAADWDRFAGVAPFDPFTSHRFLKALEDSGSVGGRSGWQPYHLVARAEGEVIGVMPLYAKSHSQGEYIFDHSFAHAYEQAGGRYYPKLQCAVPFTPATGRRILADTDIARRALLDGAMQLTRNNHLSSFHVTFCTGEEYEFGGELGLLQRMTQQFHWENDGYTNFDAFLADLSSRKRKNIRKERATAQAFGGKIVQLTGDVIEPHHWDAFWQFYQDTGSRKWGRPYLTREFFDCAQATLRNDILLVLAEREGRYIAGALNFIGGETLFGRYWGCVEDHSCLHFELCYYQAIDYAIAHGLRVEAGAQGEHKLARGYLPSPVYSLHYMPDEGFRRAVDEYLRHERDAVGEDIEIMTSYGPFRKVEDAE